MNCPFFEKWLSQNILSLIAIIFTVMNFVRTSTSILVRWNPKWRITTNLSVVVTDKDEKPIVAYKNVFLAFVEVINPSPNNLAFYDFHAYDSDTENFLEFASLKPFQLRYPKSHIIWYRNKNTYNILNTPNETSGIFKANSYTSFTLPMVITDTAELENLKRITVSFSVAKRNFFRIRNKTYEKTYNVEGWKKKPYQKPYNNLVNVYICINHIIENNYISNDEISINLKKIEETLLTLKNESITITAVEQILELLKFLLHLNRRISRKNISLLHDIYSTLNENHISSRSDEYINIVRKLPVIIGKIQEK